MKKDKIIAICISLILVVGFGIVYKIRIGEKIKNSEVIENIVAVEVDSLKKDIITNSVKYTGKIVGSEEAKVTKMSPAKITEVLVKDGDYVKKGEPIITLDSSSADESIAKAKESYEKALEGKNKAIDSLEKSKAKIEELDKKIEGNKKSLKDKNIELEKIKLELKKLNEDLVAGNISNEEFKKRKEEIERSIVSLGEEVGKLTKEIGSDTVKREALSKGISGAGGSDALDKATEMAKSMYENTLKLKENFIIRAPVSGVVTNLYCKVGDEGIDPMNPLMEIINMDRVSIPIGVYKDELKYFKVSETVPCEILSGKETIKAKGKIKSVSDRKDRITEQYNVVIELDNSDSKIKKNDFAKVFINTGEEKEANVISKNALLREGDKTFVYIVEDGKAIKREIKIKDENDEFIEVSEGISKEDRVIIKGKEYVTEGKEVNVVGGVK